jgi:hypothetical protein
MAAGVSGAHSGICLMPEDSIVVVTLSALSCGLLVMLFPGLSVGERLCGIVLIAVLAAYSAIFYLLWI